MKPTIFFAIPCGGFYAKQREIIETVCRQADVDPHIVEDDEQSKPLWSKVVDGIENDDFFVADISSHRPNIILELGYALKAKPPKRVHFFVSKNIAIPADLRGLTYHEFASFSGFRNRLQDWMIKVVHVDSSRFEGIPDDIIFREDFRDTVRFERNWSAPRGCQFSLTKGLRFANADLPPILSQTLGLLTDFKLTFSARIERERIGWAIKGTTDYVYNSPLFCVMFNISTKGEFRSHILNINNKETKPPYDLCETYSVPGLNLMNHEFIVVTECYDDGVTIAIDGKEIFRKNLRTHPKYRDSYNFEPKQGQIGFRCAPHGTLSQWGEVATVNWVEVVEIERKPRRASLRSKKR